MLDTLAGFWTAIWPNLAADALWIPVAALYHRWLRGHLRQVQAATRELEHAAARFHAAVHDRN